MNELVVSQLANAYWKYTDLFEPMNYTKCRVVGGIVWVLLKILQEGVRSESVDRETALAILAVRACHRYSWDWNSWLMAWALTVVKDPHSQISFGASESELELALDFTEAEIFFWNRVAETATVQPKLKGEDYEETM